MILVVGPAQEVQPFQYHSQVKDPLLKTGCYFNLWVEFDLVILVPQFYHHYDFVVPYFLKYCPLIFFPVLRFLGHYLEKHGICNVKLYFVNY